MKILSVVLILFQLLVISSLSFGEAPQKVREFRLVAKETKWELLPGVEVNAWTYNGQIPGPEIRVKEGERVKIIFRNQLTVPTTIHWHGLIVPAKMDGVPGVSMPEVKPGETYTYEFIAKPSGTFWYHPHFDSVNQISKGLYAPFIVEPKIPDVKVDREYILMMSEWVVPPKQEAQAGHSMEKMGGGMQEANYFTINGKSAPAIPPLKVKKGEHVRVRFINAGNQVHPMHLHGHAFKIISTDGYSLPNKGQLKDTLPVNAGERFDVIFKADNPGTWAFHCHDLHHVTNDGAYPGGLLTLVQYE
jgi:FtsP/CotA-like multicopper oxidase with cupredoxin domain